MEKFKTYRTKDDKEYASFYTEFSVWVTHSVPLLYPLSHTAEGYVDIMKISFPDFSIPDHIELIEVTVTSL